MRNLESHQCTAAPKLSWRGGAEFDRPGCNDRDDWTRARARTATVSRSGADIGRHHLSALEFIRAQKQNVQLASYDERLLVTARLLGVVEWSAGR